RQLRERSPPPNLPCSPRSPTAKTSNCCSLWQVATPCRCSMHGKKHFPNSDSLVSARSLTTKGSHSATNKGSSRWGLKDTNTFPEPRGRASHDHSPFQEPSRNRG